MTDAELSLASTLRELDAAIGAAKGTAFRLFKQLEPELREGEDFIQFRAGVDDALISNLREEQRIYAGSVHALLFMPAARDRIVTAWECSGHE